MHQNHFPGISRLSSLSGFIMGLLGVLSNEKDGKGKKMTGSAEMKGLNTSYTDITRIFTYQTIKNEQLAEMFGPSQVVQNYL
jgi:hypothetical protein